MQEKQDQKVVLVFLSIHINLEHEENTQKNKTQINLHKEPNNTILPFNQPNNTLWPVSDHLLKTNGKLYSAPEGHLLKTS